MSNTPFLLEAHNIHKAFPGVIALNNVRLQIRPGKVHILMGENGAGKSTLMKIIAGVHRPDRGEIRIKGKPVVISSPLDALNNGIAMIHQELNLVPFTSIAENIWIGREPTNQFGLIQHDVLYAQTQKLLSTLKIDLDAREEIQYLSIANRQMVEIAKAVSYNSDILIMDEPTSAITETEVAHLFKIIDDLKAEGKGIVYITHKMNEVFEIADDISVFRDGEYIGTYAVEDLDKDQLISLMVGREINQLYPKNHSPLGTEILRVDQLTLAGVFSNVSFGLRQGEILGIAGLMGSGRTEIVETLFGITPATSGEISINGQTVLMKSPQAAISHGLALLTEDRKESGLFLSLSVQDNMEIVSIKDYVNSLGFVAQANIAKLCEELKSTLQIKTPSLQQTIENLSGGNQQKALIARWLMMNPIILILDEPTRGIDVGAKAEIHRLITQLASEGVAILMISSEMPEVLGMSDRVLVMSEGRMMGILSREHATQEAVMRLASGEALAA